MTVLLTVLVDIAVFIGGAISPEIEIREVVVCHRFNSLTNVAGQLFLLVTLPWRIGVNPTE